MSMEGLLLFPRVILRSGTEAERTQQKLSSELKPLCTMAVEPRRLALPGGRHTLIARSYS